MDGAVTGAKCGVHPERDAHFACVRCGVFACVECTFVERDGRGACVPCAEGGLAAPFAWEQGEGMPGWSQFRATTKAILRSPRQAFRTPSVASALAPLAYGVSVYTFGYLVATLGIALLLGGGFGVFGVLVGEPMLAGLGVGYAAFVFFISAIQLPLYAVLGIVTAAGMTHGTLWCLGVRQGKFEDTLRAVSYANAPLFWAWIPIFGYLIAYLWMVWLETIAIREVHRVSLDKALLATVGYRLVLFFLVIGSYAGLVGLMIYAEGGTG